jgi:hypothetical protein
MVIVGVPGEGVEGEAVTVTGTVALVSIPPVALAVIVAVPAATAVTVIDEPVLALRLTIPAGWTDHLTVESEGLPGTRVVPMVKVLPG